MLLPSWVPNDEGAEWQSLNDLNEVHNMLAERAKQWPEHWKQEGRQEGREEGRLETARNLLRDTQLPDDVIAKAANLDIIQVRELRKELKH